MILSEHQKHPKLARPALGNFGRHEWAILGAPCSRIQSLAKLVIRSLSDNYRCAYVDAKHLDDATPEALPGMMAVGATLDYIDAKHYSQCYGSIRRSPHQTRMLFQDCDLVLVNGNHHEAAAQVVIIDPAKADSLKRRIGQLTNVGLIILPHESTPVFDFLEEALPGLAQTPRLMLQDETGIIRFFQAEMEKNIPLLNGLVLAGGRSERMGRDKGSIAWHGKPQREYVSDLLTPVCHEVFISCRQEQAGTLESSRYQLLPDTFLGLGPFGAILSAFRAQPDRAWLVAACDLPLLDRATIDFLLRGRARNKVATAFQSPTDLLPEPLITIWEPQAYSALLAFLAQGYSCPRKVLIHSDVQLLTAPDADTLQNVNTPQELDTMLERPIFRHLAGIE